VDIQVDIQQVHETLHEWEEIMRLVADGYFYDTFVCCFCGAHIPPAIEPDLLGDGPHTHEDDCLQVRACRVLGIPVPVYANNTGL
jgi:hypothetical protein